MAKTVKPATIGKSTTKTQQPYEPPRLMKFDKLEKLIVSGE